MINVRDSKIREPKAVQFVAITFSITITLPKHANYGRVSTENLGRFLFLKVICEYRCICWRKYRPEWDESLARFLIA